MSTYSHQDIEKKWSEIWKSSEIYEPKWENPILPFRQGKPFYNLMMFPYPSAEGLHVGNMYAFSGADIYGRYQRMQGKQVFEPIGLDGFGIHSENYAIKVGKHPTEQAKISEKNFYRQLNMIGNGFSWNEKLETYDPSYYKWTQWLFTEMFKHDLAYKNTAMVNWCPSCKTVLADEQVEEGKCERCKSEVERKEAKQWFFKITEYADRLLANIEKLKWPEKIKTAQRQWIGKTPGLDIDFKIENSNQIITVWTKFWETIFGTTYLVLAPEHPIIPALVKSEHKQEVESYVTKSLNKTEQERKIGERDKTGVFTGGYVVNPVNQQKIPVWVADYVLKDVGTGAVMGVPAHDERDFDFAKKFDLPIVQVVSYEDEETNQQVAKGEIAFEGEGKLINSGDFSGKDAWGDGKQEMKSWMIAEQFAQERTNYHLRDWLISRQRFWGAPIPMVECETCGWQPVPEDQLPVELPYIEDYKPTGNGKAPLENAPESWLYTECPKCHNKAKRETDVCDTFLDSSWYFLRYPSLQANNPTKDTKPFDPEITKTWLPVDTYIGGAEHAVLHLLYSRFVTMALKDWGHLDFEEPFPFLFGHGLIIKDGSKMSKSRGNVVNPDEYIVKFGADTLRTYLMFLGSYDQGGDFRDSGIAGMYRWMTKVWRAMQEKILDSQEQETTPKTLQKLHQVIKKCTEDMEAFKFNTAIAIMMEFINVWHEEGEKLSRKDAIKFLQLLGPFAPYLTEDLYHQLGGTEESIHISQWPVFDEGLTKQQQKVVVVQFNGKVKARLVLDVSVTEDEDALLHAVKNEKRVSEVLNDKEIRRTIVVPGKLVNFVI